MSEQKLPSVEEKKSLRELRAEKAQQIRKKDLALWAHSGAKHQDFVKKLQIGLANVEENILSDINLNTTIFSCDFYFSFDYDQILHSNHAEGFILPEYLFRQTEMEFRGWCSQNNVTVSSLEICADSDYGTLTFKFEVNLSKPYQYEMPFKPEIIGFAFVEE